MDRNSVAVQEFEMVPKIFSDSVGDLISLDRSRILDFGCGMGIKTLGIALDTRAKQVTGVDIHQRHKSLLANIQSIRSMEALPSNLNFCQIQPGEKLSDMVQADVILSWSVFEHIPRELIAPILADHYRVLRPGGIGFMQVNPLYFSAFGSHMRTVIDTPWAHLLFPYEQLYEMVHSGSALSTQQGLENVVLKSDPSSIVWRESVWNCFRNLNRITFSEIRTIVEQAGFEVVSEVTSKLKMEPPEQLLHVYQPDLLLNDGFRMVFRKPE